MAFHIVFPDDCGETVRQKGRQIQASERFFALPKVQIPGDGVLLRAKVTDSFNFVDHPRVELDDTGTRVRYYRCDCPDWRNHHRFCAHCAALIWEAEQHDIYDNAEVPADGAPKQENRELELLDLSYFFSNSPEHLYPEVKAPNKPEIQLDSFIQIFGDTARAAKFHAEHKAWGGSCFGVSITATMFQQSERGICVSDFAKDATKPCQLQLTDKSEKLGMTLHKFIEVVQVLQFCKPIQETRNKYLLDKDCLSKLVKRVESYHQGKAAPVYLSVRNKKAGHAVVPYRVQNFNENADVLHIYDPNAPLKTSLAFLQKDQAGRYLSFFFISGSQVYDTSKDGKVTMCEYEVYREAWEKRGGPEVDNLAYIKTDMAIMNDRGEVLARVTGTDAEIYSDEIYEVPMLDGVSWDSAMISLPAGCYTVRLEAPEQERLDVHMVGVNLSVELTTTAREAVICVDETALNAFAEITEPDAQYAVEILSTAGKEHEKVRLNGTTGEEKLCIQHKEGRLSYCGLSEGTYLSVNDVPVALEQTEPQTQEPARQEEERLVLNDHASKGAAEA